MNGPERRVCPDCGSTVSDSSGRTEPRCIHAACRYVGPGIPVPIETRIAEARGSLNRAVRARSEADTAVMQAQDLLADLLEEVLRVKS